MYLLPVRTTEPTLCRGILYIETSVVRQKAARAEASERRVDA